MYEAAGEKWQFLLLFSNEEVTEVELAPPPFYPLSLGY